jgi:hypothetical protein
MRQLIQTLLRILDGSPGALGNKQRGQSLVEMAFITPLLAIMIIGTVEIGWYANHILIMLEVTRVGARSGTVLTGDLAPARWSEDASIHPVAYILDRGYSFNMPAGSRSYNGTTAIPEYVNTDPHPAPYNINNPAGDPVLYPANMENYRNCGGAGSKTGFYNFIACAMIDSMEPMRLRGRSPEDYIPVSKHVPAGRTTETEDYLFPDDIVISVFSLQAMNNDLPSAWNTNLSVYPRTYNFEGNSQTLGLYQKGFWARVVGRYPTTANECNVTFRPTAAVGTPGYLPPQELAIHRILTPLAQWGEYDATGIVTSPLVDVPAGTFQLLPGIRQPFGVRDPFDYIPDVSAADNPTKFIIGGLTREVELAGFDNNPEFQRGFVWTGQHFVREFLGDGRQLFCIGSEWSDAEVEQLMNAPNFLLGRGNDAPSDLTVDQFAEWKRRAQFLPSQGVVLVEMFWNHDMMIDFPFLSRFTMLFSDTERVEISVWAVFPVPSAEPNIIFGLLDD